MRWRFVECRILVMELLVTLLRSSRSSVGGIDMHFAQKLCLLLPSGREKAESPTVGVCELVMEMFCCCQSSFVQPCDICVVYCFNRYGSVYFA